MPTYGPKLRRLLRDSTLIDAYEIAELLGVSVHTVKKWYLPLAEGENRQTRLPEADPAHATTRSGKVAPRWPTKVIAAWAVDFAKPGGQVFLDYEGEPVPRMRRGPGRPKSAA